MYLIQIHSQDNPEQVVDRLYIDNIKQYNRYWESYQKTYPGKITGYELRDIFIPERTIDDKIQGTSYKTKKFGIDQLAIEKILEEIMTNPAGQVPNYMMGVDTANLAINTQFNALAQEVQAQPPGPGLLIFNELNQQP